MTGPGDSPFPPIEDYGFLSDCETGALVAADGAVEWLPLPRFDSPSVFAAVLDRGAGSFRLAPPMRVPIARRYLAGTNILETTWATDTGWLVVRDLLVLGPWRESSRAAYRRAPGKVAAERLLLRVAECTQGEIELELACEPFPGYATSAGAWSLGDDRTSAAFEAPEASLQLRSDLELGLDGSRLLARRRLEKGGGCFCALGWGDTDALPRDLGEAAGKLDSTAEFWRDWLAGGRFPDHPWRIHLQRSALVLKGLIYTPTGATVAAPTTSLPETPGGERNWDYRFTWVRDATFTLWGLHVLGLDLEAQEFIDFIGDVCRGEGAGLQIMYGIGGERDLTECTLDHLGGYGGARPVRIGNAAHDQRQNDVYGALLDSLYIHLKAHPAPEWVWPVVREQVEAAAGVWQSPDRGIWEARGEPRHYVSSKLMCWVALDRGARLAQRWDPACAARWQATAAEIKADVLERGVSSRGVFRQHYDTDELDASTLLAPLVRFLPSEDERVRATVLAVEDELTEDGLVLRYRVEATPDGLTGTEGTFTICSFWLVSALSEIGEPERARKLCERLLRYAGPLGLFAEEIEPHSGRHLGNFPQAFTHLALINAVSHVVTDAHASGRATFSAMRR